MRYVYYDTESTKKYMCLLLYSEKLYDYIYIDINYVQ